MKCTLKEVLSKKGISQRVFSERMGVDESTVSYWCKGRPPNAEMIGKICKELKIKPNSLLSVE